MSQKINAIIFSRDRAAQLKLLLDSIDKYAPDVFDINVIINYTNEDFCNGYNRVINNKSFCNINFVIEDKEIKNKTLELLKTEHNYSCFFLDDDILYNEIKFKDIKEQLNDDDVVCFSLRLGKNVTNCYTLDTDNVMHDIKCNGNFMKWDWKLHYLDFGYPFAMNGHIFRKKDIYKLVKKSNFTNVEELEMALYDFAEIFPRNLMTSYKKSALVNVPIGRVQMSVENEMTMTLKEVQAKKARAKMNEQLLKNNAPLLKNIKFKKIKGCHQELDIGFKLEESKGVLDAIAAKKYGKLFSDLEEKQKIEIKKTIDAVANIGKK